MTIQETKRCALLLFGLLPIFSVACTKGGAPNPVARTAEAAEKPALDFRGELVKGLARAEKGNRWGFVNGQGRWVIQPTFDWAESFAQGLAAVKKGKAWGYVDGKGKAIIAPGYQDAGRFSEGLAAVKDADGWRFVDRAGKVRIPGPFTAARHFRCGQARVKRAKVYFLGDRTHGAFAFDQSTVGMELREREEELEAVEADAEVEPVSDAAPKAPGEVAAGAPRVDLHALTTLFSKEVYAVTPEHIGKTRGLPVEPQWEEDVWLTIDARGKVIPPAEVRPCGKGVAAAAPPSDKELLVLIRGLHRGKDRSKVFRRMTAIGHAAVPALLAALKDKKIMVRLNALKIIVRMGPQAAPAIPELTRLVLDRNRKVFFHAAWALGRMEHRASLAVPNLVRAHRRDTGLVEAALLDIGPAAVAGLVKLVEGTSEPERRTSIQVLEKLGPAAAAAVPALRRASKDSGVTTAAALALASIGTSAADVRTEIVTALVAASKDRKASRRAAIAAALGRVGSRDPAARAALIQSATRDRNFKVRLAGVRSLAPLYSKDPSVSAALLRVATRDRNSEVRLEAARPLVAAGSRATVPILRKLLMSDHQDQALVLLARLGKKALAAAPEILAILDSSGRECKTFEFAGKALFKMGKKPAVVVRLVKGELEPKGCDDEPCMETDQFSDACDTQALKVIKSMGPAGAAGIRQLMAYRIDAPSAGSTVSSIVRGMGPPAMTSMIALLQKTRLSRKVKRGLLETLGALGKDARGALPALAVMAAGERNKKLKLLAEKSRRDIEKAGAKKEGKP